MPIIALDDAQAIQEILYMLDPSLTAAEVPDAVVTARPGTHISEQVGAYSRRYNRD